MLVCAALVPALTDLPLCRLGGKLLPAFAWLPQLFSNEIAFWARVNALILLAVTRLSGSPAGPLLRQPRRTQAPAAAPFALAVRRWRRSDSTSTRTSASGSSRSSR